MKSKSELRKEVRLRKKQYTETELRELSHGIVGKLLNLNILKTAKTVMLYCSLSDEVYTLDLIHQLKAEGKTIVLPVVTGEAEMEIRRYDSDADLRVGSYNILEPCGEAYADISSIDVIIMPGMGFDKSGNRMGRGKGYYDRFLKETAGIYKIGICFPFQIFSSIPTEEHDIPMDIVIS